MSTLFATPAMRAAVFEEAELAGLPARVQAIARSLALTSTSAARAYIAGQRHQANADGRPHQGNGAGPRTQSNSAVTNKPAPVPPTGERGRPGELVAKTIKLTVVLDPAAVGALVVPDGGRPRITVSVAGRRLTAELNPKTLGKTIANIREHGPDQVAVVLQGTLAAGDVVEAGAIIAQVKTPKPAA
jgi:hypothetical protein